MIGGPWGLVPPIVYTSPDGNVTPPPIATTLEKLGSIAVDQPVPSE